MSGATLFLAVVALLPLTLTLALAPSLGLTARARRACETAPGTLACVLGSVFLFITGRAASVGLDTGL